MHLIRSKSIMAPLTLLLVLALAGPVLAAGITSPATGHAQVIAQGVTSFSESSAVWRVSIQKADPAETAKPLAGAATFGFAVAASSAIGALTSTTDAASILPPGEAAFMADWSTATVWSPTKKAVDWTMIDALAKEPRGDGSATFVSEPFDTPSGLRDVNLVRDVLQLDDETSLAEAAAPILIYVQSGALILTDGDGNDTDLAEGEAGSFSGDLTMLADDDDTAFVAVVVGDEVTLPKPKRTTGTIGYRVLVCPSGVAPGSAPYDGTCTENNDAIDVSLTGTGVDSTGDESITGSYNREWQNLPFGDYQFMVTAYADPAYIDWFVNGDPTENPITGDSTTGYSLQVTEEIPDIDIDIFVYTNAPIAGTNTLTVGGNGCPYGVPSQWAGGSLCFDPLLPVDVAIVNNDTGDVYDPSMATINGDGSLTWASLPDGSYSLYSVGLPAGYGTFVAIQNSPIYVPGVAFVQLDAVSPNATVIVYAVLDPASADTDGDGLPDLDEGGVGLDPTLVDTDGDSLWDGVEQYFGTDPMLADTDADGMGDGDELNNGTDPTDPGSF